MILYNPTVSGSLLVTGSLTTTGTLTSQTLVVQTITSSIEFNTGSTRNGTLSTNTHEFTGSVLMTGSLAINGTTAVVGSGTANYVPKFTASGTIGNSAITDDGTTVVLVSRALSGTSATFTTTANIGSTYRNNTQWGANLMVKSTTNGIVLEAPSTSDNALVFSHTGTAGVIRTTYYSSGAHTPLILQTSDTDRLYITTAGNVGIGTSSPYSGAKLQVKTATNINLAFQTGTTDVTGIKLNAFNDAADTNIPMELNGSIMILKTGENERMRITSGGLFKVQNNGSSYESSTAGVNEFNTNANDTNVVFRNTATSLTAARAGADVFFANAAPNNTGSSFYSAADNAGTRTLRFEVRSNGGIANYSANNVSLSDIRTKKDIVPLGSYWNKFKDIEIVKFKYKDQTHDDFNIGVIAQQVESIAPEFVDVDGWGDTLEDGIPLKSIYETDLYHATIKVLQEAMIKIEELSAKNTALEEILQRNNIQ
jgi:hypothetical protein